MFNVEVGLSDFLTGNVENFRDLRTHKSLCGTIQSGRSGVCDNFPVIRVE